MARMKSEPPRSAVRAPASMASSTALPYVLAEVALARRESPAQVAASTTATARAFFGSTTMGGFSA